MLSDSWAFGHMLSGHESGGLWSSSNYSDPDGQVQGCLRAWLGKVLDALPPRYMFVLMMDAGWNELITRMAVGKCHRLLRAAEYTSHAARQYLGAIWLCCAVGYVGARQQVRGLAKDRSSLASSRLPLAESARNLDQPPVAVELDVLLWFDATLLQVLAQERASGLVYRANLEMAMLEHDVITSGRRDSTP
eukprot:6475790-Amphidinium_carterae.2